VRFYLHGFASGPSSEKGRLLEARFAARGMALERLDLTPGPDGFERSSISSMCGVVEAELDRAPGPHVLIGSSLGGYVAARVARRRPDVERLVLIAPAFDPAGIWRRLLGDEEIARWRREGLWTEHYVTHTRRRLGPQFLEDAERQPQRPPLPVPTLVIAGTRDETIPLERVRAWVAENPNATLKVVDDDHAMVATIEEIFEAIAAFLPRAA
jgi:pimeloyl-ACP methyl ester carboxylesterase